MKRSVLVAVFLAAVLMSALIGCSSAIEMTSSWNDKSIVIDGSNNEWGPSMKPLADPPIAIGVRNDEEFLYVCLSTRSPLYQAQIVNGGLTVWFDPGGKQEKNFGIHFPNHGENAPHWNPREPIATSFPFLEPSFREIAILGPEDRVELISILEAKGIKVKIGVFEQGLVYEMQAPLRASPEFPHAAGISDSWMVAIGFQTEETGSSWLRGPTGRSSVGSGRAGRRGSGDSPGAGSSIEGASRPEVLGVWTKVSLASQRQ